MAFDSFLAEGIQFMENSGGVGKNEGKSEDVRVPSDTLAQMRVIKFTVEKYAMSLRTGLRDGNVFSTDASDYANVLNDNDSKSDGGAGGSGVFENGEGLR